MVPCDVYLIRKQLYISDEHERALKARAKDLDVSEAELVRRMLDGLLLDREGEGLLGQALRRPWRVSSRRPTCWRSSTASREGMCSTEMSSTRTAYEDPLGNGRSLCGGHQRARLRHGPQRVYYTRHKRPYPHRGCRKVTNARQSTASSSRPSLGITIGWEVGLSVARINPPMAPHHGGAGASRRQGPKEHAVVDHPAPVG
jgi:hypothetical protein